MKRKQEPTTTIEDKMTAEALERVVNQTMAHGEVKAYLCKLQLPKQFAENPHQANDIYKRIQSDFCKHVSRTTGSTPRYVAVKKENADNPEYAFCLFTKADATLDKPEEYAEKGREIANGKTEHAGWGRGKLDVVEIIMDGPKFIIGSQPIMVTDSNKTEVFPQLQQHLQSKRLVNAQHQRTLFVSKCP